MNTLPLGFYLVSLFAAAGCVHLERLLTAHITLPPAVAAPQIIAPPVVAPAPPPLQEAETAPPPAEPEPPPAVPLQVLAGAIEPLHADDPELPDKIVATSRGKVLEGTYKMCISREGKVQSVTPVVSIEDEGVDRCVVDTLKTWQFPKLPLQLCKLQTMRFEIQ